MLVDEGYEIGVYPRNLWGYVRHEETPWPYYESEGGTLIVGQVALTLRAASASRGTSSMTASFGRSMVG